MTIFKNKGLCLLLTIITFIFTGCAKISSPAGGPRDKTPPEVVESEPVNGARNFKGKKLVITFNEFIVLEKINDKFMVSPPMSKKPDVYIRGKNLVVEFEDNLKDSTTYTFNFQDAVRDLNEGNIYDNFSFVFSTGKVIDSLSVTGKVFTALNLEYPENTSVLLYRNLADSAAKKVLPDYISRADPAGNFRINNIRPGTYKLYALKDIDNSKNYNLLKEEFGFMDSSILVTPEKNYLPVVKDTARIRLNLKPGTVAPADTSSEIVPNTIILFKAAETAYYLTSSERKVAYRLGFTLSLPPDTMNFSFSIPGKGKDSYFVERSRNKDTMNVWITDSALYSQQQITAILRFPFTDTTGKVINNIDTIPMRYMAPRLPRAKVRRTPLQVNYSMRNGIVKPGEQIVFTSPTPFRKPDTSLIRLYETTAEKKQVKIPYTLAGDTANSLKYIMYAKMPEGKKYLFIADSAAFKNIYGETSDSAGIRFSVPQSVEFGTISVKISEVKNPLIIQLLNKEEKVLKEKQIKAPGKVVFSLLDKGSYRIRAIFDMNGDGQWTTGDYSKKRQPEPVSYFKEIELASGWIDDEDWTPSVKNLKNSKLRNIKKR